MDEENKQRIRRAIAVDVMGWQFNDFHKWYYTVEADGLENVRAWWDEWKPDEDIAAAWQVLDKLVLTGWYAQLNVDQGSFCIMKSYNSEGHVMQHAGGEANTMPEAICKAAYQAVTGKRWENG